MERKVTKISASGAGRLQTPTIFNGRKRVCAYVRVSTDHEDQMHSYMAQMEYYENHIKANPEWIFAGIYSDAGVSGTITKKRSGFMQMVHDASEGKIDIILTKSISRFARNTVDLLRYVRLLRDKGVDIHFEKENIRSISTDGEFMLTIFSSIAQEEVRSLSENVRWARKKKIDKGEPPIKMQVTGYTWEGDALVIEPEGAAIVRRIFSEYMDGRSPGQICKRLKKDGIKTIRGHWFQEGPVYRILRNVIYKGDLLLQKTFVEDPISKVAKWNTGELPMVYVEDDHEPIIEPVVFDAVQAEMQKRKDEWDSHFFDFEGMRTFTHMVKCELSGLHFRHSGGPVGFGCDGAWNCDKQECPYRGECGIKQVPDLAIRQAVKRALGKTEFDEGRVRDEVEEISTPKDGILHVKLKDGIVYEDYFRGLSDSVEKQPKNKNCFSKKLICGLCGRPFTAATGYRQNGVRRVTWYCRDGGHNSYIHENVLKRRVQEACGWDEFTFERFRNDVERIDMDRPCHMTIHMKDGTEYEAEYYSEERIRWANGKKDNGDSGDEK